MPLSRSLMCPTVRSSGWLRATYDENCVVGELINIAFKFRWIIRYGIEALEKLHNARVHRG